MGQQQILLIVLGIILVGIAITIGVAIFQAQLHQNNIDAIVTDLNNLGAMAYQYRIRYSSIGGSENSYAGFDEYYATLPDGLTNNLTAQYTIHELEPEYVTIQGTSKTIQENDEPIKRWMRIDAEGQIVIFIHDPLLD